MTEQEENLSKLNAQGEKVQNELKDKQREGFLLDSQIEDESRESEKQERGYEDAVQYKEEIYAKFGNNQDRALKGKFREGNNTF